MLFLLPWLAKSLNKCTYTDDQLVMGATSQPILPVLAIVGRLHFLFFFSSIWVNVGRLHFYCFWRFRRFWAATVLF